MMKVEVLTVMDVDIKSWKWWTDWIDVSVFNYGDTGYLLQMKVSRNNSKKFRATQFKTRTGIAHPNCAEVGDIMPMSYVSKSSQ